MTERANGVALRYAGLRRERPPLVQLLFDLELENSAPEPRWFLVPNRVGDDGGWPAPGVTGVDLLELEGVLLVRFFAPVGGFHGVLAPSGAQVGLKNLPVRYWGENPDGSLELQVVVARSVRIDGRDVGDWLDGEVMSSPGAAGDADGARRVRRRHSESFEEFPLSVDEEHRLTFPVELAAA